MHSSDSIITISDPDRFSGSAANVRQHSYPFPSRPAVQTEAILGSVQYITSPFCTAGGALRAACIAGDVKRIMKLACNV